MSSIVYFTSEITSDSLLEIYEKLDFNIDTHSNVAMKISTGEPPHSNYLRPEFLEKLVDYTNSTIVECNTAYRGERSDTRSHENVIRSHGFDTIAYVDILDSDGEIILPTSELYHYLQENVVGSHMLDYESMIVVSHFKGHQMAGYGGALKNISIGLASSRGKALIHTAGNSDSDIEGPTDKFLKSMADACSSIMMHYQGRIVFINVMNNLSIDCDCNGHPEEPKIADIGILASYDPVALDAACLDLIYQADGNEDFLQRLDSLRGQDLLGYCEDLGVGTTAYELVSI